MKGVLLHHWDTDGLASCAILRDELKKDKRDLEWSYFIPQIGNYFLTEEEMRHFEDAGLDELTIADMAIPSDQVKRLAQTIPHVTHYDHHYQPPHNLPNVTHINPVAQGREQSEAPACTFVLMEHFKRKFDMKTAIGVVGDLEHKVFENATAAPKLKPWADAHGLCYMDLIRMVDLLNSNFRTDDIEATHKAATLLTEIGEDPGPIIFSDEMNRKLEFIQSQVDQWLNTELEDLGDLLVLRMESSCHIISTVGRHLFRRYNKQVLLTNTGLKNLDQIYVRGFDLRNAINYSRSKGLRAGGKKDAFGAITKKGGLDEFLPGLIEVLTGKGG